MSNVMSVSEWRKRTGQPEQKPVEVPPALAPTSELKTIPHYGKDKAYTGSESEFQKASARLIRFAKLNTAYHVPNETRRPGKGGDIERIQNKLHGVLSGVADWCIPVRTNTGNPGAYLELKVKGGKLSGSQNEFLTNAREQGYFVGVVWNLDALQSLIKELYG